MIVWQGKTVGAGRWDDKRSEMRSWRRNYKFGVRKELGDGVIRGVGTGVREGVAMY